jgi:hypothetical protein
MTRMNAAAMTNSTFVRNSVNDPKSIAIGLT